MMAPLPLNPPSATMTYPPPVRVYDSAFNPIPGPGGLQASRKCELCPTLINDMPEYYKTCNTCFGTYAEMNLRECVDCGKSRIHKEDPPWKTRCGTCYKEGSKLPFRTCSTCGQPTIHPLSAKWRKVCTPCYQSKKQASHTYKAQGQHALLPKQANSTH